MTISHVPTTEELFRDPLRIPHTLSSLHAYWSRNPELNFGEIIGEVGEVFAQDPYHLEDETFLEYFRTNTSDVKPDKDANEQIIPVLSALEAFWMKNTDLRLGQIVSNALPEVNSKLDELQNAEVLTYLKGNQGTWEE